MTIFRVCIPGISRFLLICYVLLSLAACSSGGGADSGGVLGPTGVGQIALSWLAPSEREDGTPISMAEIAGYRVYYGTSQGEYTGKIDVADSNSMQATLSSLAAGVYYIAVTVIDMNGLESAFSEEITRAI